MAAAGSHVSATLSLGLSSLSFLCLSLVSPVPTHLSPPTVNVCKAFGFYGKPFYSEDLKAGDVVRQQIQGELK